MKTITLGKTRYTVRDDRMDIMAAHAKCTGKHKLVKSKGAEKRLYPIYGGDTSTAEYVAAYEKLNKKIMPWDWQPLRADPCLAPVGEDSNAENERISKQKGNYMINLKKLKDKIDAKCSFVSLESIDDGGFCFDIRLDEIIFGPWGIENSKAQNLITADEMPLGELRDRGMTKAQETQLMREINDAMDLCSTKAEAQEFARERQ